MWPFLNKQFACSTRTSDILQYHYSYQKHQNSITGIREIEIIALIAIVLGLDSRGISHSFMFIHECWYWSEMQLVRQRGRPRYMITISWSPVLWYGIHLFLHVLGPRSPSRFPYSHAPYSFFQSRKAWSVENVTISRSGLSYSSGTWWPSVQASPYGAGPAR